MNETELFIQILKESKKQTFYAGITAAASAAILLVLVFCLAAEVPRVNHLVADAENALVSAEETLDLAQGALTAVEKVGSIDYDGLNKAIQDLQDTIEPFAKFVNLFK